MVTAFVNPDVKEVPYMNFTKAIRSWFLETRMTRVEQSVLVTSPWNVLQKSDKFTSSKEFSSFAFLPEFLIAKRMMRTYFASGREDAKTLT